MKEEQNFISGNGVFVIASHNRGKIAEMADLFRLYGIRAVSQEALSCGLEPEETGATFEENALLKARAVCKATGYPAIADDSGLEVPALGGEPGIYSARYAGENATDAQRIQKLLEKMAGFAGDTRAAHFVSVLALVMPNGRETTARGECEGKITQAPAGDKGFGYDPVFFDEAHGMTFGELDPALKNAISHRACAMKLFAAQLPAFLAESAGWVETINDE